MEKVFDTEGVGASHHAVIGMNVKRVAKNKIDAYEKIRKDFDELWSYKIKINIGDTLLLIFSKIFNLDFSISFNKITLKQKVEK